MEKIDNLGGGSEVRTTDEHGGERSGGYQKVWFELLK